MGRHSARKVRTGVTFNTKAGADALKALLVGLGLTSAQLGVPESIGPKVTGYVTAGGQATLKKATGTVARDARYTCTLAYRIDGAEAAVEGALMDLVDAFLVALHADLTLGGVCLGAEVDLTLADAPEYILRAGKEFREFPIIVTLRQNGAYTVNP